VDIHALEELFKHVSRDLIHVIRHAALRRARVFVIIVDHSHAHERFFFVAALLEHLDRNLVTILAELRKRKPNSLNDAVSTYLDALHSSSSTRISGRCQQAATLPSRSTAAWAQLVRLPLRFGNRFFNLGIYRFLLSLCAVALIG
jgi:hypothetical protein